MVSSYLYQSSTQIKATGPRTNEVSLPGLLTGTSDLQSLDSAA